MKIGLVDVDGHAKKKKWGATIYPNIALGKISRYHKERGDWVEWAIPFFRYDRIYMSKAKFFQSLRFVKASPFGMPSALKAASKHEQSHARMSNAEREQARR